MSLPHTRHRSATQVSTTRLNRTIGIVLLLLEVYIALSVVLRPGGSRPEFNFKSEHGSITLLSSAMFLVGAGFAVAAFRAVRGAGGRGRLLWAGFAAVLLYFSIDEVVGFHEAAGDVLDAGVGAGPFRTWNDLVVLAYGVVALPAVVYFRRELFRYHRFVPMLVISAFFFVATSAIDSLSTTPTTLSIILEEGVKVHCSVLLMLSSLTGLFAARLLAAGPGAGPENGPETE
ncbi:MAG: hypothetical protein QG622_578 [Actinomycetota bacterium]|nr:hypothetical protein [Actinomycetota bacterium]